MAVGYSDLSRGYPAYTNSAPHRRLDWATMSKRVLVKSGNSLFNSGRALASDSVTLKTRILGYLAARPSPTRGRTFSIFRPDQGPSPQLKMPEGSKGTGLTFQQAQSFFQQDLKAVDPAALANAMGGDKPPEEPLLSTFEEGFGYFTAAAVGRLMERYQFARKVRTWLPRFHQYLIIRDSSVGQLPHLCGSLC